MSNLFEINWHHAPVHRFIPGCTYMITAGTYLKRHYFQTHERLRLFERTVFKTAREFGYGLHVWALFSDHYHLIAQAQESARSISKWLNRLHSLSAAQVNKLDTTPGRRVWFEFWDTCITFKSSFWARVNYVANNPVHHRLVTNAADYPFCSAAVLERTLTSAQRRKLASFKYDRVRVRDEFEPVILD